jgi:SAM-dependent methyltransferase
MLLGDDHELICRTALAGKVEHLDEPLYVYHVHGDNTWLANAEDIERIMWETHAAYFTPLAERWARAAGLGVFDLGGALDAPAGYTTVDRHNADILCDLDEDWPLGDGTAGILRAHDVLEHISDPVHAMNEAWRVLAHGGVLDALVPSTRGEGAFCDPTHKSFWNKRSFRYYTEAFMRRYLEPEARCVFQVVRLEDVTMWDELPYVHAQLLAVHEGPRIHGELLW